MKRFQKPQDSGSALKRTRLASTTSPGVPCSHITCCGETWKAAPDPDDILPLKPCLLRRKHNLEELRRKACKVLAIDESLTPVTLVLAEDGTIADNDDDFLCLPPNTKFVALACSEEWTYNNSGKNFGPNSQCCCHDSFGFTGKRLLFVRLSKHLHGHAT